MQQKINILAYNIITTFQLATTATEKMSTPRRTTLFLLRSIRTIRFEWLRVAGRVLRPGGRRVLRLANDRATREKIEEIDAALSDAA